MFFQLVGIWLLLAVAAVLEVGGDAAVRMGLRGARWGFLAGPAALVAYGFLVNVVRWDFSRLMGAYIVLFFLVSQAVAVIGFREKLQLPTLVGGGLIVLGGLVLSFWQTPGR